jgi:hypothetical protein
LLFNFYIVFLIDRENTLPMMTSLRQN